MKRDHPGKSLYLAARHMEEEVDAGHLLDEQNWMNRIG